MYRKTYVLAFPLMVLFAIGAGFNASVPGQGGAAFTGPSRWIPFVAKQRDTASSGTVLMTSTVAQSSNGSYYWRGEWPDGTGAVVINNVATSRNYNLPPGQTQWISRPMVLPPNGYRPARAFADHGFQKAIHSATGLEVFVRQKKGRVEYFAPSLNFFPVKTLFEEGKTREVYELRLGEPPAELFTPPGNAAITILTEPGGIIHRSGPNRQDDLRDPAGRAIR